MTHVKLFLVHKHLTLHSLMITQTQYFKFVQYSQQQFDTQLDTIYINFKRTARVVIIVYLFVSSLNAGNGYDKRLLETAWTDN